MTIKAAIKTKLEAVGAVSAAGMTVYTGLAPQGAPLPYIVMNRIPGGEFGLDHGGLEGWNRETWQVDLFHADDETLEAIRNAIITAIHGTSKTTWSGLVIHGAFVTDAHDTTELESPGAGVGESRQTLELVVKYEP